MWLFMLSVLPTCVRGFTGEKRRQRAGRCRAQRPRDLRPRCWGGGVGALPGAEGGVFRGLNCAPAESHSSERWL